MLLRGHRADGVGAARSGVAESEGGAMIEYPEVMDIRAAAHYLSISPDTLYGYALSGFIPAFKLGNRWRFKKSIIDKWMAKESAARSKATK